MHRALALVSKSIGKRMICWVLTRISSATLSGEHQPAPGKHQAVEALPVDESPPREPPLVVHCRQAGGWTQNNCKTWIRITQMSGAWGTAWMFIKIFRGLTSSRAGGKEIFCDRCWAISLWRKQGGTQIPADSENWNPTALVNYLKHISNLSFGAKLLLPLQ